MVHRLTVKRSDSRKALTVKKGTLFYAGLPVLVESADHHNSEVYISKVSIPRERDPLQVWYGGNELSIDNTVLNDIHLGTTASVFASFHPSRSTALYLQYTLLLDDKESVSAGARRYDIDTLHGLGHRGYLVRDLKQDEPHVLARHADIGRKIFPLSLEVDFPHDSRITIANYAQKYKGKEGVPSDVHASIATNTLSVNKRVFSFPENVRVGFLGLKESSGELYPSLSLRVFGSFNIAPYSDLEKQVHSVDSNGSSDITVLFEPRTRIAISNYRSD